MQIHDPGRHEPLVEHRWDPAEVRSEIEAILSDIAGSSLPEGGWSLHPLDAESFLTRRTKWCLYSGASGVIVASEILRNQGYPAPDMRSELPTVYRNYLRSPDIDRVKVGLHLGEIGILTPAIMSDPANSDLKTRLHDCMSEIVDHGAREITFGQTGMMHAALALFEATGDEAWERHYRDGAQALWRSWQQCADGSGWFWDNRIFGQNRRYFGACHGLAGNVGCLLAGAAIPPDGSTELMLDRAARTLEQAAVRDKGMVNWFASAPPVTGKLFVQWCHGAAGIVTALRRVPNGDSDGGATLGHLIEEAAFLVWHAGPLKKGPGICHGTAGNGYAFLTMYRRTGERKWLDRARAFATHAILQSWRDRARYGQRRFSLMTGDAGLAVYLHDCLNPAEARIPGLGRFS